MSTGADVPAGSPPFDGGRAWLEAAIGGGLPDPVRTRWQPLRVGIVDLWEYDQEEFWAADGRLVLRGGNGAGKTKVLELTTLMLLRGEIGASVLDPFGSQHRTMRFNLLPTGEADDPRPPADSGLGYAWAEFGRLDESGQARFLVVGMGVSARRGSGTTPVTTWQFVTQLRPGKDLVLRGGGRAIDHKDLRRLDGVWVAPSAAAYRMRIADELFGLTPGAFDNLTDLLKQLRRPKLGERLNPTTLAETLRDALPALAEHELTQLADGWDRLDRLRVAVEKTEQAARVVATFVRTGWRPWARLVVRREADAMAAATTDLDRTTRDKRAAEQELDRAKEAVRGAEEALTATRAEHHDRAVELRELLDSTPYQDAVSAAGRVESLREQLTLATERLGRAQTAHTEWAGRLVAAAEECDTADAARQRADARVTATANTVRSAGAAAGLPEAVDRHLPERDHEGLGAALAVRRERFAHLASLHDAHGEAGRQVDRSAAIVEDRQVDFRGAQDDETATRSAVGRFAAELDTAVRAWAAIATLVPVSAAAVDRWCGLVPGLAVVDAESGDVDPGPSVVGALREYITARDRAVEAADRAARLDRAPLASRLATVGAELERTRAAIDEPPPEPTTWRRRTRPELDARAGAPLWRLVNPAPGVDGRQLARLEASLAASGLLDVWVTPDGRASDVDGELLIDVVTTASTTAVGRRPNGLSCVLVPETAGGVAEGVVAALLDAVGWHQTAPRGDTGPWLAADGSWRVGEFTGRAEAAGPAAYVGAAARADARRRRIDELDAERARLDELIAELDLRLARLDQERSELERQHAALPGRAERTLTDEVARLAERGRRVASCRIAMDRAQRTHDADVTRRDSAWAEFAGYAGRHRFALEDLPGQRQALDSFAMALTELRAALRELALRTQAFEVATTSRDRCARDVAAAAAELGSAGQVERAAAVRLRTAESALSAGHRELLVRRTELDRLVDRLTAQADDLSAALSTTRETAARAGAVVDGHEERRAAAEAKRNTAVDDLWLVVDAGLVAPLGIELPDRRTTTAARDLAVVVRREIGPGIDGVDRAWRRCFAHMNELRQHLLPDRDAHVADEAPGPPRVELLTDPVTGWEPPVAAAETLAERARQQRMGYDAEQQQVLTTLLGSTFIEHLKERLDHTEHTLARINDQLARHPTRYGHSVRVHREAAPGDVDAAAVVAALSGRGYHELSSAKQDMMRAFLARRIDEARSDAATGSAADSRVDGGADWKEQLNLALDYRRWLRLTLQYRAGPGAPWTVFDVARHGAKSGGEKVVLLSQPLFAAAVVAYDAAGPHAPRWVWLDEAMTGVDAAVKASFMGLTVEFELDVMLTAHDEWCTYPSVPAVAVYDLARPAHVAGVDVVPYLWCGGDLTSLGASRLGAQTPSDGPDGPDDGLFGLDGA